MADFSEKDSTKSPSDTQPRKQSTGDETPLLPVPTATTTESDRGRNRGRYWKIAVICVFLMLESVTVGVADHQEKLSSKTFKIFLSWSLGGSIVSIIYDLYELFFRRGFHRVIVLSVIFSFISAVPTGYQLRDNKIEVSKDFYVLTFAMIMCLASVLTEICDAIEMYIQIQLRKLQSGLDEITLLLPVTEMVTEKESKKGRYWKMGVVCCFLMLESVTVGVADHDEKLSPKAFKIFLSWSLGVSIVSILYDLYELLKKGFRRVIVLSISFSFISAVVTGYELGDKKIEVSKDVYVLTFAMIMCLASVLNEICDAIEIYLRKCHCRQNLNRIDDAPRKGDIEEGLKDEFTEGGIEGNHV
ncbi:putative Adenosine deaminase [Corchorus capsularis]|uniref:Putative Adenosine deaminase n=1 Tax=Corchorus capsularis TaxID=210143 RepID=A0A1R3G6D4_COCAP|nr:putative Adenosine deaminase [Corchorus capsularis]